MDLEKERRRALEHEVDFLRKEVIGSHKSCNGTGFIERLEPNDSGFIRKIVEPCGCRKKFDGLSKFFISNVPYENLVNQQIYGKLVTDVLSKDKIELRKEIVNPYIKYIRKVARSPYGLLFLGKNGTGKTFIGLKILYHAVFKGLTVHNIEMTDLLRLTRKLFKNDQDAERLLNEIFSVDILMIDEIGNESKRSEYVISEFKSMYKKRVSLRKPTILISNYSYPEFKKVYGVSITNMIQSYCKIFDFSDSADIRKTKCSEERDQFFKKIKKRKKKKKVKG